MIRRNVAAAILVVVACVALGSAQVPPPAKMPEAQQPATAPDKPVVPSLTDQDQQTFALLLYRVQVQQEILAVLQKEVDSTSAEISRLLARLQRPDFDLIRDPQTGRLVYVRKPEPTKEKQP